LFFDNWEVWIILVTRVAAKKWKFLDEYTGEWLFQMHNLNIIFKFFCPKF